MSARIRTQKYGLVSLSITLGLALALVFLLGLPQPALAQESGNPLGINGALLDALPDADAPLAAPSAIDDVYTATEDTPLVIAAPGVLDNDSDPESDPLTATLTNSPVNGVISFAADGSFTYTPAQDFNGTDTFVYQVQDGPDPALGYWPFDDGTNPSGDESGNGHPATLNGNTAFTTTVPVTLTFGGLALDLDGVGDEVTVSGIDLANRSFSVAFWSKRELINGAYQHIVTQGTGSTNLGLHISFRDTNIFTCAFWNNDLNTSVGYTDTGWHHWACTYDASTNQRIIYRDGVAIASDTASADYQGSGTLYIGSNFGGTQNFPGLVDDVRVYPLALSQAKVQSIMSGGDPDGLVDIAQVTLNVTPTNDPPSPVNDAYTTTQGTPYVADLAFSGDLGTTFAANNGQDGNMFDVTAGADPIWITALDLHVNATGSREIAVYYKSGTYAGSEQTPGNWTLLGTQFVDAQGSGSDPSRWSDHPGRPDLWSVRLGHRYQHQRALHQRRQYLYGWFPDHHHRHR